MSFILRTLLTCELSMHISETQILNKSTLHEYRLLLQPSREHHHTYQNNGYTDQQSRGSLKKFLYNKHHKHDSYHYTE